MVYYCNYDDESRLILSVTAINKIKTDKTGEINKTQDHS